MFLRVRGSTSPHHELNITACSSWRNRSIIISGAVEYLPARAARPCDSTSVGNRPRPPFALGSRPAFNCQRADQFKSGRSTPVGMAVISDAPVTVGVAVDIHKRPFSEMIGGEAVLSLLHSRRSRLLVRSSPFNARLPRWSLLKVSWSSSVTGADADNLPQWLIAGGRFHRPARQLPPGPSGCVSDEWNAPSGRKRIPAGVPEVFACRAAPIAEHFRRLYAATSCRWREMAAG